MSLHVLFSNILLVVMFAGSCPQAFALNAGVESNNVIIVDGSLSPSPFNNTDFGKVPAASGLKIVSFYIRNFNLNFYNLTEPISLSGPNAADFSVIQPEDTQLNDGESALFQIWFNPSAVAIRSATVKLVLNGEDYTFAIQGEGAGAVNLVLPDIGEKLGPKVNMRKLHLGENSYVMDIKATLELTNSTTFDSTPGKVEVYYSYDDYLETVVDDKVLELPFKALPAASNGKQIAKKLKLKLNPQGFSGTYFIRVIPDSGTDNDWTDNQLRLPFRFL